MDGPVQSTNPNPDKELDLAKTQTWMADNDLHFLLFFIMGTYFGPHIKGESPQKSVLQRIAMGLPPYTSDKLAGSQIKTVEIERIYHYVLRKADQSAVVKLHLLRQFFQGNLPKHGEDPSANYPQFPDLFPPSLHPHSWDKNQFKIVENIIFINSPDTCYIDREDIERFRMLTGLEDFVLDEAAARLHPTDGSVLHNGEVMVNERGEESKSKKTRRIDELLELDDPLKHEHLMVHLNSDLVDRTGPAMVFLPSFPTKSELSNIVAATKSGFALTGSAAMGNVGPSIGLMDIGECEDAYLFRISLPGVKRDAIDFSCEVESDGKVLIRGVATTGEKTVFRYSQMFEMQTQNLCPPGRFSISFKLPGPVEPQQFSGASPTFVTCSSRKPQVGSLRRQSSLSSHAEAVSLRNEGMNETGSTSSEAMHTNIGQRMEKGTSKWQLKGKRNSRQISKTRNQDSRKCVDVDDKSNAYLAGIEHSDGISQGSDKKLDCNGINGSSGSQECVVKSTPVDEDQGDGFQGWSKHPSQREPNIRGRTVDMKLLPNGLLPPQRLLPYRQSRFTVHSRYRMSDFSIRNLPSDASLYEVKLEVKANYRPPHVPLVSLMSKLNGKAIVGHPLVVEALEDGYCDSLLSTMEGESEDADVKEKKARGRIPKHLPLQPQNSPHKSPKTKKSGLLPKKIRKLSSLTSNKKSEERKSVVEKPKGPVIACVPLKLVFSRINEAVNGSARQTHRVQPPEFLSS